MILFICSTPYHIYNVVSLASTVYREDDKDLYILDHSSSNYEIYLKLKEEKIFNKVLYLKTRDLTGGKNGNRLVRYYNSVRHYLNSDYINKQILNNREYKSIFISSPDIPSQLIYYFYKNNNIKTQLFMYEDGTFAYNYFDFKFSNMKKRFLKLLFDRDIMAEHSGAYVYQPNLMENVKDIKVYKIPNIKGSHEEINLLNKVMDYQVDHSKEFNKKFIFFDQAFQFEETVRWGKELLGNVIAKVGKENIVVKLHPRTDVNKYDIHCKVTSTNVPYELIALNNKIDDKVLVSINSTACFNPKIMFGDEPVVILLYKLVNDSGLPNFTKGVDQLAEKIKASYTNPERFCIPNSVNELNDFLSRISN